MTDTRREKIAEVLYYETWGIPAPQVNEIADAILSALTPAPETGWRDMDSAPDWEGFGRALMEDWEGFGRALMEDWPTGDIDGSHLFDMSLKYGLITEVPGGYNPDEHIDAEGICPETGDPWYEYAFGTQPATEQPVYETCSKCSGSGQMIGDAGEPTLCSECKGDTVVASEQPSVKEAAVDALASYQQADEDGIMVLVSRQAIEECLPALRSLAGDE